jgi:hypothetical protein
MVGTGLVEAPGQTGLPGGQALQIVPINPQDHPLIGFAVRLNNGLMELHGADEQKIPRLHMVYRPLHPVFDLSAEEKINLVKIVVMYGDRARSGVPIVEYLEISGPHVLARIKSLGAPPHGTHLPWRYVTARIARSQTRIAIFMD